jgi:hypothetical protein
MNYFMQPPPFRSNAGFQMLLFRFSCFQIILLAFLAVPVSQASAQREDIGDQPGLIPNAADEELPLQFRRQIVLYRSTEAPGTIIVHTAERFLYVVQPNGRALRYGIGVGREGFQWHTQAGMARLDSTAGDDRAPALPAPLYGRRTWKPHGRASALPR